MSVLQDSRLTNGLALLAIIGAGAALAVKNAGSQDPSRQFLNVSYDPTRELYREIDRVFSADRARATGRTVAVAQSHGGSGRQARAVIAGLPADVVTLAMHADIVSLQRHGLVADGWEARLPHDSRPYTSTIVFVVRRGNPRQIRDWPDLVKPGVAIVTPDPRTSGNGKLSFLGAWGSVIPRRRQRRTGAGVRHRDLPPRRSPGRGRAWRGHRLRRREAG